MGSLQIVIVKGSVEIRRHTAYKIIAVLPLIKPAHFQPGNFRNGIGFIGFFQRSCEKRILRNGLWRHPGIDTGAAQKEKFFHLIIMTTLDYITLYLQIVIDEIRRNRMIGADSPYFGCCQHHCIRAFRFKKRSDRRLIRQFQFPMGPPDHVFIPLSVQAADDCTSYQPPVARHINFIFFLHTYTSSLYFTYPGNISFTLLSEPCTPHSPYR